MAAAAGGLLVGQVLLGLLQAVAGGFECDLVVARLHGGQEWVPFDLQLRHLDVGLGSCPRRARASSSLAWFSDSVWMTFCWASARSASASRRLYSCWVVSNCTTTSPVFHRFTRLANELGDGERILRHHGRDQHFGLAALEFAASRDRDGDRTALDPRDRASRRRRPTAFALRISAGFPSRSRPTTPAPPSGSGHRGGSHFFCSFSHIHQRHRRTGRHAGDGHLVGVARQHFDFHGAVGPVPGHVDDRLSGAA